MAQRRRRGTCGRCGGQRRRNAAAPSQPVADCIHCQRPVCQRHVAWDGRTNAWVCTACARTSEKGER